MLTKWRVRESSGPVCRDVGGTTESESEPNKDTVFTKDESFDTRPKFKPDCATETEMERSRKFLHFAAIRFIERSMLTTKSLRIESLTGGGNLDGFTYKWLIIRALS